MKRSSLNAELRGEEEGLEINAAPGLETYLSDQIALRNGVGSWQLSVIHMEKFKLSKA